jgi:plasmid segregation protein ParM
MLTQSINIPSVIERYNQPLINVSGDAESNIQLYEGGNGYLIGSLALQHGLSPYRNINSSPADLDYQLLAKSGLMIAGQGKSAEIVLTTGFPYTTYELFKQQAINFYTPRDIFIEYNGDTYSTNEHKRMQITVRHIEIVPEIIGCIDAIRKGPIAENDDFFVVSLGYGTCETGLSVNGGLVGRTCMSVVGLRHAVNNLHGELSRSNNLGMKNEHMINQNFQGGSIVVDRKRKDLTDLRRNQLLSYYKEVVSPTLKKTFTDNDFAKAGKLYLVGGGALYTDLVDCFCEEFDGVLDILIPDEPNHMASLGYAHKSYQRCGNIDEAVGLDIGNAYTVVSKISSL